MTNWKGTSSFNSCLARVPSHTGRIHVWYTVITCYLVFPQHQPNVGTYASPMDPMVMLLSTGQGHPQGHSADDAAWKRGNDGFTSLPKIWISRDPAVWWKVAIMQSSVIKGGISLISYFPFNSSKWWAWFFVARVDGLGERCMQKQLPRNFIGFPCMLEDTQNEEFETYIGKSCFDHGKRSAKKLFA